MAFVDELRSVIRGAQPQEGGLVHLHTLYQFIEDFQAAHPLNNNIAANIRADVQKLRDMDELEFVDDEGLYRTKPELYLTKRGA